MKLVLAVTCYERLDYLKAFLETWLNTKNNNHDWTLIIADDGSNQNQINFIDQFDFKNKVLIKNKRRGISYQTNCIFNELNKIQYDLCFKCDEDIYFLKKGWDDLYCNAITKTNYQHFCHDNPKFNYGKWCEGSVLTPPVKKTINGINLIAYVKNTHSKGCFFTVTPKIQEIVGYMDVVNFFHGYEHVDFSLRCARANFNDQDLGFDIEDSQKYIQYRFGNKPSLSKTELKINGSGIFSNQVKKDLLLDNNRLYIPFIETNKRMIKDIII